jgi:prevent-host-death family protein
VKQSHGLSPFSVAWENTTIEQESSYGYLSVSKTIHSIAKEILNQVHHTQRPVILTVNGKADAVLMDTKTYEKHLKTGNMARLLARAEEEIEAGRTRPIRAFVKNPPPEGVDLV